MAKYVLAMGGIGLNDEEYGEYSKKIDVFKVDGNTITHEPNDVELSSGWGEENMYGDRMVVNCKDYVVVFNTIMDEDEDEGEEYSELEPRSEPEGQSSPQEEEEEEEEEEEDDDDESLGVKVVVDVFRVTDSGLVKLENHGIELAVPRIYYSVASCGKYVFVVGGVPDDWSGKGKEIEVFEATDNGFKRSEIKIELSVPRFFLSTCVCGNYLFAISGNPWGDEYDEEDDKWIEYGKTIDVFEVSESGIKRIEDHGLKLDYGRYYTRSVACGNYVMVIGGYAQEGDDDDETFYETQKMIDVIKVTDNGFEMIKNHGLKLEYARLMFNAVSAGNSVLVIGGESEGHEDEKAFLPPIEIFKVTANGIRKVENNELELSPVRDMMGVAACDNYVFVMGGAVPPDDTQEDPEEAPWGVSNAVDVFQVS